MSSSLSFELGEWTIYCGEITGMLREKTSCAVDEMFSTCCYKCSSHTRLTVFASANDFCDRRDVGWNQAFQTREVLEVVGSRSDDAPTRRVSILLVQPREDAFTHPRSWSRAASSAGTLATSLCSAEIFCISCKKYFVMAFCTSSKALSLTPSPAIQSNATRTHLAFDQKADPISVLSIGMAELRKALFEEFWVCHWAGADVNEKAKQAT